MSEVVLSTIRIKNDTRRKLKIIAGYEDISINTVITRLIEDKIADWEQEHGKIELPK